jgi:hypothetical protein
MVERLPCRPLHGLEWRWRVRAPRWREQAILRAPDTVAGSRGVSITYTAVRLELLRTMPKS